MKAKPSWNLYFRLQENKRNLFDLIGTPCLRPAFQLKTPEMDELFLRTCQVNGDPGMPSFDYKKVRPVVVISQLLKDWLDANTIYHGPNYDYHGHLEVFKYDTGIAISFKYNQIIGGRQLKVVSVRTFQSWIKGLKSAKA